MEQNKLNKIIHIDFLQYSKQLEDNLFDLVILDPPYNVRAAKWDIIENYYDWMINIIKESVRVLKPEGSLYLWGMSKNNDFLRLKLWMDDNIELEFKNWIVWLHDVKIHTQPTDRYLTKHEDLLFYSGKNNIFNIQRDSPTETQLKIFDGKYDDDFFVENEKLPPSQQKIFKNGLTLGSPAKSWWKGTANKSNGKNIKNFAGYKSEWVCDRIINVSSNENSNVLIPFGGSGTEIISCMKFNRNYIATEILQEHCDIINKRVAEYKILEEKNSNKTIALF